MLLLDRILEFSSHLNTNDLDLPYVVFGFLAQPVDGLPSNDPRFVRVLDFINEFVEMRDREFENLVQVAMFERFAANPELATHVKRRLRSDALRLFAAAEEVCL